MRLLLAFLIFLSHALAAPPSELRAARDRQDRAALEKTIATLTAQAEKKPADAQAQYTLALAQSYLAEICLELRLRNEAKAAAEKGIQAAEKAAKLVTETFGLKSVDVFVKGPDPGRDAAIRGLKSTNLEITSITDNTPIPHNGVRGKKRRHG